MRVLFIFGLCSDIFGVNGVFEKGEPRSGPCDESYRDQAYIFVRQLKSRAVLEWDGTRRFCQSITPFVFAHLSNIDMKLFGHRRSDENNDTVTGDIPADEAVESAESRLRVYRSRSMHGRTL